MTTLTNTLRQLLIIAGASLSATFMFTTSTASAADGGYYTAELASPVDKTQRVIQGVVWRCDGTVCEGTKTTSRPVNVCTRLARKMGPVTSFTFRDETLEAETLDDCNETD